MVTAGFLAFLLCVASVTAAVRSSSDGDGESVCEARPNTVFQLFFGCVKGQQPTQISLHNKTKDQFIHFIENTCTTVLPAARACFADHLSQCDTDVQQRLNRLAAAGGFLCQPESAIVEQAVLNVFDHISDDDFTQASSGCPNMNFDLFCLSQLAAALTRDWSLPTLEAMIFSVRSLHTSYYRCEARRFQTAQTTCPFWRAALLRTLSLFSLAPAFGVILPFNATQLAQLFQI